MSEPPSPIKRRTLERRELPRSPDNPATMAPVPVTAPHKPNPPMHEQRSIHPSGDEPDRQLSLPFIPEAFDRFMETYDEPTSTVGHYIKIGCRGFVIGVLGLYCMGIISLILTIAILWMHVFLVERIFD